jgi:hypothetical protein
LIFLVNKTPHQYLFGKIIESNFKGAKSLKMAKTQFWQKLKNEAFAKKKKKKEAF